MTDNSPADIVSSPPFSDGQDKRRVTWGHSALVAEVYDISHPLGSGVGDVEYYTRALRDVEGSILEPACGTGRILIPLLEAGHRVDGVDYSPHMLEICRSHCRDRGFDPTLYIGEMSTFTQPETYEAVIVPRGSIRNVEGRDVTLQALRCFHASLIPGGRLVLDVTIPLFVPGPLPLLEHWTRDACVYTCETLVIEYEPVLDRTVRYARYTKWHEGELVATELHRFFFQHWNARDFQALLAEANFEEIEVTGDFGKDAPRPSDRYWNFTAWKPKVSG